MLIFRAWATWMRCRLHVMAAFPRDSKSHPHGILGCVSRTVDGLPVCGLTSASWGRENLAAPRALFRIRLRVYSVYL